ncbi:CHC2 zinc finger domain-containing protein [Caulobacter segnis]
MRFDDRFLEELKSRLRPSDVVGKTVKLRRQGREHAGLSPFTKEKSLVVLRQRRERLLSLLLQRQEHGDIISFLQETEPAEPSASAVESGWRPRPAPSLPAVDPRDGPQEQKRSSLGDWMELATAWFEAELRRPGGQTAPRLL